MHTPGSTWNVLPKALFAVSSDFLKRWMRTSWTCSGEGQGADSPGAFFMAKVRQLLIGLASSSALYSGLVPALGLGEITLHSALSQPNCLMWAT
jgi:hypothetical protein